MKAYLSDPREGQTPFRLCALHTVPSASSAHTWSLRGPACSGPWPTTNTEKKLCAPLPYELKRKTILTQKRQRHMYEYLEVTIEIPGFLIPFMSHETKIFLFLRWHCMVVSTRFVVGVPSQSPVCAPLRSSGRCRFLLKAVADPSPWVRGPPSRVHGTHYVHLQCNPEHTLLLHCFACLSPKCHLSSFPIVCYFIVFPSIWYYLYASLFIIFSFH